MPRSSPSSYHRPAPTLLSQEGSTAYFLERLEGKSLEDLRRIKDRMAIEVHELLLSMDPKPKILLKNAVAAGSDADGLASNDGSSKYLMGGLVSYSGATSEALPLPIFSFDLEDQRSFGGQNFDFYKNMAGAEDYNVMAGAQGDVSGPRAGEIVVYAGDANNTLFEPLHLKVAESLNTSEHRQALQELTTIATYDKLLTLLNRQEIRTRIWSALETPEVLQDELLKQADEIYSQNQSVWKKLSPMLHDFLGGQRLSIGESFTSGILAKIISANEGAKGILDYCLNWYDPRLKQMVGLPPPHHEQEFIAEPEAVAFATLGLLNRAPKSTQMTLGTTGWANYWVPGQPDYFSVGVAEKSSTGPKVSTAYVKMTSSKDAPRARGRRQLTRHLGATVAIYMLVNALSISHPNITPLEEIKVELIELIHKYAEMEVKENVEVTPLH